MKLLFKNKKEDFLNRLKKQEPAAQKIFYDQNVIKEIVSQIPQVPAENIFAKTDSVKVQIKKKRYVDPSTLLFSVEHKDVIENNEGRQQHC